MKLLIDIGNSRTKFALYQNANFTQHLSINNNDLSLTWLDDYCQKINEIIIANVGPIKIVNNIEQWAKHNKIPCINVISERSNHGVLSFYQKPEQLGVDRWLALIGTASLYTKKNVLIIDTGTATTIDLLNSEGKHLGGWIFPGINMLQDSLVTTAINVVVEKAININLAFGDDTSSCVNHASWAATLGCINMAIEQAQQLMTLDAVIILGGNANALASLLKYPADVTHDLIFHGLLKYSSSQ